MIAIVTSYSIPLTWYNRGFLIGRRGGWGGKLINAPPYKTRTNPARPVIAMSGPMPPVPADEFVLPLPAAHDESTEPLRRSTDSSYSRTYAAKPSQGGQKPAWKVWRHTVGIALLLATVVMWTASNFLASVGSHHAWFKVAEDTKAP